MDKKKKLRKLYEEFRKKKFPRNNLHDEGDIHAETALLDGDLAGILLSYLDGTESKFDVTKDIELIKKRILEYKPFEDEDRKSKEYYIEYINLMEKVNDYYREIRFGKNNQP